jgi:hypothetical protein
MPEEKSLQAQIDDLRELLESAFEKDAHGDLRLSEHKFYHKFVREQEEETAKKRKKLLGDVISWAVIGALSILCSVVYEYVSNHSTVFQGLLNF